jgi:hypothetical protein
MRSALGSAVLGLVAASCGDPDVLEAHFLDEVVGAPARFVEVTFLEGATCQELLAVLPQDVGTVGTIIATRNADFPINPEDEILKGLPRERPIVIHIVARDGGGGLVGRGCDAVTLGAATPIEISIELRALPKCDADYRYLDLTIVLDTSFEMAFPFPGDDHINLIRGFVEGLEQGTKVSVVTHGHTPPSEYLPVTSDLTIAGSSIAGLINQHGGTVDLFNSVALAARSLRSRAVCRFRPAILAIHAGLDPSTTGIPLTEAKVGLYATVGDDTDDIFLFGIFASENAKADLEELIAGLTLAGLEPGTTSSVLQGGLLDARFALDGLIIR